ARDTRAPLPPATHTTFPQPDEKAKARRAVVIGAMEIQDQVPPVGAPEELQDFPAPLLDPRAFGLTEIDGRRDDERVALTLDLEDFFECVHRYPSRESVIWP